MDGSQLCQKQTDGFQYKKEVVAQQAVPVKCEPSALPVVLRARKLDQTMGGARPPYSHLYLLNNNEYR